MPLSEKTLSYYLSQIRRVEKSRAANAEKNIRRLYKALLTNLIGFLGNEYAQYAVDGALTVSILQEKVRYAKFLEEIEQNIDALTPKTSKEILNVVEETYSACYLGMIDAVKKAKNTKEALKYLEGLPVRPEVMKRAIENPVSGLTLPDRLQKNRKDVIYDIKQQINISLMNGDRYETTAKKIAERLDISYGKATNIVRTETHRVQEGGFMDSANDIANTLDGSGLVYIKIYRNMGDERVRPQQRRYTSRGWKTTYSRNGANHIKINGQVRKVTEPFEYSDGVKTMSPGNSGYAKHDCRCRCFVEYDLITADEYEEIKKNGGYIK
ncbi:MAG: hypothetical protein ACI4XP_03215 [Acutalibacteraceae bacterium]